MNDFDLVSNTGRGIAPTGIDPYAAYGAQAQDGMFLSFSRVGEFEAGQDKEQIAFGTRLVANMPGLKQGWRYWRDGQVVDDLTAPLGTPHPRRNELGDTDQAMWERDKEGKPRDPWVMTDILEMSDGETNYIFSATSKGGRGAIQRLCGEYAKGRRARPDMLPIIKLGRDSYVHKEYGKTYFPVFAIVGWTDEENPSVDGEDEAALPIEEPPQGQRAANPTQEAADSTPPTSMTRSPSSSSRRATRF